jgi:hypothetical protein
MSKQPLFPGAAPPAAKRPRVTTPAIATSSPTAGADGETESSAAIEELAAKAAALDAKEKTEDARKQARSLRQKQRRALGLRYDWVLAAVKWLVCCFPETGVPITVTQGGLDPLFRSYGVSYQSNFLHKELGTFAKHYSVQFEREFGEGWFSDLLSEWRVVVQLVVERRDGRWKRYTYNGVWQAVYQHNDIGEKAKLLIEIEIAFIMDTACAERWFSLMANLKDKKRNRMNDQLLNQLMFICLHAPKDILALKKIVDDIRLIWKASKDRHRKKWAQWEVVADQMALDELSINEDF